MPYPALECHVFCLESREKRGGGPAKSNSHLSVVLATNLYLPRYDAEPTGDKRIRLELVRWWCGVEAPLAMP